METSCQVSWIRVGNLRKSRGPKNTPDTFLIDWSRYTECHKIEQQDLCSINIIMLRWIYFRTFSMKIILSFRKIRKHYQTYSIETYQ